VNLLSEGSWDELQRRLNEYVRAHAEHYIRVSWVFQFDETMLRAELKDCGLEITGLKEDLALCLFQYVRNHLEEFLAFPPELEVMGYVSERH
jgi:hypothetical protein